MNWVIVGGAKKNVAIPTISGNPAGMARKALLVFKDLGDAGEKKQKGRRRDKKREGGNQADKKTIQEEIMIS